MYIYYGHQPKWQNICIQHVYVLYMGPRCHNESKIITHYEYDSQIEKEVVFVLLKDKLNNVDLFVLIRQIIVLDSNR